jgi:hypothetical protein
VGSHQGHSRERRQSEVDIESSGRQPLSQRSEEERGALTSAADRHRVRQVERSPRPICCSSSLFSFTVRMTL